MKQTEETRKKYQVLWNTAQITARDALNHELGFALLMIERNKQRYVAIAMPFPGMPFSVPAAIHCREAGFNFKTHLHNGDPLTAKTVHVPSGRPKSPPANAREYTFEESAADALRYHADCVGIDLKNYVWDVPNILWWLESYNGWGYANMNRPTPYLWSGTQHYSSGKYVRDGMYNPAVRDQQIGCVPILKRFQDFSVGPSVSASVVKSRSEFSPVF